MENNESNFKSQQPGGLNLMTVFIVVLALHVVAIGGITAYYMLRGSSTDADLAGADTTHKNVKADPDSAVTADSTSPDAASPDKSAVASTPAPATDEGSPASTAAPATTPTPAPEASAPTETANPSVPVTPSAPAEGPVASTPSGPIQSGPVITPPQQESASATTPDTDTTTEASNAPATETVPVSLSGITYTVKSHDSLARIAHQHRITLARLRSANDLKTDHLRIGQKLVIPSRTQIASSHRITPDTDETNLSASTPEPVSKSGPDRTLLGDSIPSTPHARLASSVTSEGTVVSSAKSTHHFYTVSRGDTLKKIARMFRTTSSAIIAINNINNPSKLRIGQKLRIPSSTHNANTAHTTVQPEHIQPRATPSAQLANFVP